MSTTTTPPAATAADVQAKRTHRARIKSLRDRLQAGPDKAAVLIYAETVAEREPTAARAALAYIDATLIAHEAARLQLFATLTAEAVGTDQHGDHLYSREEALADYARTLDMGGLVHGLRASTLADLAAVNRVPNLRLRREVIARREGGPTNLLSVLARAIGAVSDGKPDVTYVRRLLGLETVPNRAGYEPTVRLFITYEQAEQMAIALDLDFQSVGV